MIITGAPAGFGLVADATLERLDSGRLLVGGSPLHLVRVTDEGARRLDRWLAGEKLGPGDADRRLARRLLDAGLVHSSPGPDAGPGLDDATVVVPVRDDADGLAELLAALGGSVTTVVVDDASDDPASIAGVARRRGARLVARAVNGGPAAARNSGLDEVTTPVTVFVDADAVVDPAALRTLLGHFADPSVAAAAPRVRSRASAPGLLGDYEDAHSPLDMGDAPSPVGPGRRVAYVPGAVLAVRTAEARRVGGFDAALRRGEDVDFVWRLVQDGHTVRYEPGAVAWHRARPDWRTWLAQRRHYGASAAELAARHGAAAAPARGSLWSVAAWGAVALRRPLAGATVAVACAAFLAVRLRPIVGAGTAPAARLSLRLAARAHAHTGLGMARAVTRAWFPAAVVAGVLCRRLRPALAAAALAPPLVEWCRGRRPAGPAVSAGLRIADDLAYCTGVWEGMAARRRLTAVRPDLASLWSPRARRQPASSPSAGTAAVDQRPRASR